MPQLLLCTLCDDVRFELGNKHTLVGLFDTFNVADFAQPLPPFRVFARFALDTPGSHEVPFGVAYSVADIFADPHIAARGDIETVDDPVIGPVRMQGVYPRFSRTPGAVSRGAPRLGAHNEEVYGGLLGLTTEELEALRRDGVI